VTGGIIGTKLGADGGIWVMGALGTIGLPGAGSLVGVATGALLGGAFGGIVGDEIGGKTGNNVANYIKNQWRESLIKFLDERIAQPVALEINKVTQIMDSISLVLPDPLY